MTLSPPINPQSIIQTLTAQRDLYAQLADLARQQSAHVASGESESLMTVLAARSRIIDLLEPLDKQLQPYKQRWQELLDSLSPADRSTVSALLAQVQKLLADILAQDEADKKILLQQKTDLGSQINQTVTGSQLNRAYGLKPKPPAPGMGLG